MAKRKGSEGKGRPADQGRTNIRSSGGKDILRKVPKLRKIKPHRGGRG